MIIISFLVYSLIISFFSRDSQSTAATPAKLKNLATSDGNSPGKPRGFTVSQTLKKMRSPGGRGQIVWVSPGNMGRMWRTYVPIPEQADDNERNGILKKRQRADLTSAYKRARGLKMTSEEKAAENAKNAELEKARRER